MKTLSKLEAEVGKLRSIPLCSFAFCSVCVLLWLFCRSARRVIDAERQCKWSQRQNVVQFRQMQLLNQHSGESTNGRGLSRVEHPQRRQLGQIWRGKRMGEEMLGEERQKQIHIYPKWFAQVFWPGRILLSHAAGHSHWHAHASCLCCFLPCVCRL